MPRHWKWIAGLTGIAIVAVLAIAVPSMTTGRRPADFRTNDVVGIELSMRGFKSGDTRTTEVSHCLQVLEIMRTSRAARYHECKAMGNITVRYSDGTTNHVALIPGHGFGRIELGDATRRYSLSRAKLFGALKRARLLPDDFQ